MPEVLDGLVGYPALALVCFLCGILLPMPEDVPQLWAGMQIASGEMSWLHASLAIGLGVFARDIAMFGIGRTLGDKALTHPLVSRLVGAERLEQARERVRARGPMAVLIGRFTVGFRAATFFAAGSLGVSWRDFLTWDGLALLASVPVLLGVGYTFGEPAVTALMWLTDRPWLIAIAVVGLAGLWLARQRHVRLRTATP